MSDTYIYYTLEFNSISEPSQNWVKNGGERERWREREGKMTNPKNN